MHAVQALAVTVLVIAGPALLGTEWLIRKVEQAIADGRLRNTTPEIARAKVDSWKSVRRQLAIGTALAIAGLVLFR